MVGVTRRKEQKKEILNVSAGEKVWPLPFILVESICSFRSS